MSRRIPPEDTQPWYRQFWPWFLISLPASVVVAGLSTLYIANRHADDLVVDCLLYTSDAADERG